MPIYEFKCKKCSHKFELITSSSNSGGIECPSCKSKDTEKLLSTFSSKISGSSGSCKPGKGFT